MKTIDFSECSHALWEAPLPPGLHLHKYDISGTSYDGLSLQRLQYGPQTLTADKCGFHLNEMPGSLIVTDSQQEGVH